MTAGSGIVIGEMPPKDILENSGEMEGLQLWVDIPAKEKMTGARYQDTTPESCKSWSQTTYTSLKGLLDRNNWKKDSFITHQVPITNCIL